MAPPRAGPQKTSATFSPTPTMRPPTMAPGTEVKPPRISTGSAFSAPSEIENCTPRLLPHMMPATSPTTPATDQTMTQIERSGMPTDWAAWWSSATARKARPILGCGKKKRECRDQRARDRGGDEVEFVYEHSADDQRCLRDADVERMHVPAPDEL